jgi:hypothetical protein
MKPIHTNILKRALLHYMSTVKLLIFISLLVGCDTESFFKPSDPAIELARIESIREKQGYVPMEEIRQEFQIQAIDFSRHEGIKRLGVTHLVLERRSQSIAIMIASNETNYNRALVEMWPRETGLDARMTLKTGEAYSLAWGKYSEHTFRHHSKKGRTIAIGSSNTDRIVEYETELKHIFHLSTYVLFAIREPMSFT